jgi:hypothetical protein
MRATGAPVHAESMMPQAPTLTLPPDATGTYNNRTCGPADAQAAPTTNTISARGAVATATELRTAVVQRRSNPLTLLNVAVWADFLCKSGLLSRQPTLVPGLSRGFDVGIRPITISYSPHNSLALQRDASAFNTVAHRELEPGHWVGPLLFACATTELGPIRISPCSVIDRKPNPKDPHAPPKKRLIQDHSSPVVPRGGVLSINGTINIVDYPCTWGCAGTMELLVWTLPNGLELAIRDVETILPIDPAPRVSMGRG